MSEQIQTTKLLELSTLTKAELGQMSGEIIQVLTHLENIGRGVNLSKGERASAYLTKLENYFNFGGIYSIEELCSSLEAFCDQTNQELSRRSKTAEAQILPVKVDRNFRKTRTTDEKAKQSSKARRVAKAQIDLERENRPIIQELETLIPEELVENKPSINEKLVYSQRIIDSYLNTYILDEIAIEKSVKKVPHLKTLYKQVHESKFFKLLVETFDDKNYTILNSFKCSYYSSKLVLIYLNHMYDNSFKYGLSERRRIISFIIRDLLDRGENCYK